MKRMIAVITAIAVALVTQIPQPASATDFNYWSLWIATDGDWEYAQVGMGSITVIDGMSIGWRFVTAGSDETSGLAPQVAADFSEICSEVPVAADEVRVVSVVDYPVEANLPAVTECIVVAAGSTAADVLNTSHLVRSEGGFVCAVDEWPKTGCAEAAPIAETSEDVMARWVTIVLGVILFALAWRGLLIQKGMRKKSE